MKKLFGILVALFAVVLLASCGGHKHSFVKHDAKAPTCEESGNKEYYTCEGCDLIFSDDKGTETTLAAVSLDATGHNWGEWTQSVAPTCEAKGQEKRVCANDASHVETRDLAALGHNFGEWTQTVAPTCTEKGTEERVCANDNSHKETREVEALGHDFGEWTLTTQPTCDTKGVETRVCSRDASHTETREVEALGHTMEHFPAVDATFDEPGNKEYWLCSVCNRYFKDALGTEEYAENEWIVPVHDHVFVKTDAVAPSCLEGGNNEYYTCSICDRIFVLVDEEYQQTTLEAVTLVALGHDLSDVEFVDADCDETAGNIAYKVCSRCGGKFDEQGNELSDEDIVIPAGHNFKLVKKVASTCSEQGNIAYALCERCGKMFQLDKDGKLDLDGEGNLIELSAEDILLPLDPEVHNFTKMVPVLDDDDQPVLDPETGEPEMEEVSSWVSPVEATCHDTGMLGYAVCADCGKIFAEGLDEDGYPEIDLDNELASLEDAIIPINEDNHVLIEVPGTAPTFEADGVRTYYYCQYHEDLWFSDEFGENLIQDHVADIIAPMLVVDNELLEDAKLYALFWYEQDFSRVELEKDNFTPELYADLQAAYDAGQDKINSATTIGGVSAARLEARQDLLDLIPAATGEFDFSQLSTEERTELTGIVERYVVSTGLTGMTLYESASVVLYNPRVQLGTENYIPNYGFGVLPEGNITAGLDFETNEDWKMYYHTYETSDPATANYWNDKGAQVGDLFGFMAGSLFETFMSEEKDSYVWVGSLSKDDRPLGKVVDEETGDVSWSDQVTGTTWRVRIRTKADGLKYTTFSQLESRQAYNNLGVEAEDYLTAYKLMLTQSNGLFRGSEAANSSSVKIEGILDYFTATENCEGLFDQEKWDQYVGDNLKVYEEDGEWYFEWTNNQPTTSFYAMYYIAGSLYTPVPMSFVELVTLDNIWGYNKGMDETPVDNSLALGAYALEAWFPDQAIVWKKNPNYVFADTKYRIQGVHEVILKGIATDPNLAIKKFLDGELDAASLTKDYLEEYKNDERAHKAQAGSNFKLNANTANQATWEYYFGVNGVVAKTPQKDYWDLKPAMSNPYFYKALSYALDRNIFADKYAAIAEVSYLGSAYQADAEKGLAYNMTQVHKDAIYPFLVGTGAIDDETGEIINYNAYSLQLAREYFRLALAELEEQGAYIRGTAENPTIITLEIAWMYPNQEDTYHADVKKLLEDAFNDDSVSDGCYLLNVEFWAGATWSDVYYNKLMLGQFDLGFGSISGNAYNILDYMTVLSADQSLSGGFTLNWGPKTDDPDHQDLLLYNGMKWSFDALISAANGNTIVKDGVIVPAYVIEEGDFTINEDGSATFSFDFTNNTDAEFELYDLVPFGYPDGVNYDEESCIEWDLEENMLNVEFAENDGVITITFNMSAELLTKYAGAYKTGYLVVDVYMALGKYSPKSFYYGYLVYKLA